ncbi:hypothetical protein SH580_19285 [Coraliomargarita algicola]|uniref:Uncharacterized protein n=1 Tax=Coraliomargarita algicola TaxID=3092156 RepID=A0ABZ0RHA5_9BACT|nr:hypothetical protein [Coraliomargarita sp. J2-16]WPJ95565.1 hypothetical protein SH580_19285 [Coraliomargarita sp. J2-16]
MLASVAQSSTTSKLWLRAFAVGAPIHGLYYEVGSSYRELKLLPFEPGPIVSVSHPGASLPLYTRIIDPETQQESYVESAKVIIPKHCSQLTIVVMPKENIEGIRRFDTIVFDDSGDDFPINSVRLINLSPYEVAAHFGDKTFQAQPGQFAVQAVTVDDKSRVFAVAGQLLSSESGYELQKFYQGPVTVPDGSRLTLLAVYSLEAMRSHDYEVIQNAAGENEIRYIVVKWLDRPISR